MVDTLYKLLWIIIHFTYNFIDYISHLALHVYTECVRLPKSCLQMPKNFETDKESIENVKKLVQKLPGHILVILGDEKFSFECMANLVCWSIFAGVNCISFYDYKGSLFPRDNEAFKTYLQSKVDKFSILWQFKSGDSCNGHISYKNGSKRNISINFLNYTNGAKQISELCKDLAINNINVNNININYIDRKLSEMSKLTQDPDLAIYFGEFCCPYGALPWQIRLTEFFNVESQQQFTINVFLNALCTYSKCEQRFGK